MSEPVGQTAEFAHERGEVSGGFSLWPIMFEGFVCSMAMMAFVALAAPIARILGLEPWQIGAAMTVSGIAWMVMARIWGAASDRTGRRPIILFGVSGFAITYLLLTFFIDFALRTQMAAVIAFAGIMLGRAVAGVFYAAVPATSAALIADHVAPQERAKALAAIGASSAAGMVVGPGLAGLIGPYSLSLPLYLTGALPVAALIVLWVMLPHSPAQAAPGRKAPKLNDKRLYRPMMVAFVAMFCVAIAQITVGFFALDRLQLETEDAARAAGIALALVGVSLVIAQIVLRQLAWPPSRLIVYGALIGAVGFGSVTMATNVILLWTSFAVAAFGMGWVYPSVSALAANSVGPGEQGAAAGSVAAAQGLGVILGPIVGSAIYTLDETAPYAVMGVLLVAAALWPAGKSPLPDPE